MRKTKVFLVDGSALSRQIIPEILSSEPDIIVSGTAGDPFSALPKLKLHAPDVILLEFDLPRMDGLAFLELLKKTPETAAMRVILFSSLAVRGSEIVARARELGAADCIAKPKLVLRKGLQELRDEILHKVRAAAHLHHVVVPTHVAGSETTSRKSSARTHPEGGLPSLIAIGSSTGGTQALRQILRNLPANLPPIVIVQHMPDRFTGPFAQRLNSITPIEVKEAQDGDKLQSGHAYLAPGSHHLQVYKLAGTYRARLLDSEPVNGHKPSVDVLFDSCARVAGPSSIAVILTGMGNDGAKGLLALHTSGAFTIAQNQETSVVFGMPKEAIALGAADAVLPLGAIAAQIQAAVNGGH